ncbi:MAG: hypothetical protein NTV06_00685 [candidate division Zixibacteria bacterium]|nr:hypothetical protein [candidate division Zixibacteria bacterium]
MKRFLVLPPLLLASLLLTNLVFAASQSEQELAAIQKKIANEGLNWTASSNPIVENYTPEERKQLLGLKLPPN